MRRDGATASVLQRAPTGTPAAHTNVEVQHDLQKVLVCRRLGVNLYFLLFFLFWFGKGCYSHCMVQSLSIVTVAVATIASNGLNGCHARERTHQSEQKQEKKSMHTLTFSLLYEIIRPTLESLN